MNRCAFLATFLALSGSLRIGHADDDGISSPELAALGPDETRIYRTNIERGERHVFGGIVYASLPVPPARAYALLRDRERFPRFFPSLKGTRMRGENPPDHFIEFEYGAAGIASVHTLRVRYTDRDRTAQFWVDPRFPHDIKDAWGSFKITPDPNDPKKSLLTYAVLADLGFGLLDAVLEEKVSRYILSVPERMQRELAREAGATPRP